MAATTSPFSKFIEGIRYNGREGHWAFILHRVSGLAILFFVVIHVVDTSWVYFWPEGYGHAIELYGSIPFLISEYALFAAIVYHAINGLNIILKDTFPNWWNKHLQARSFWTVIVLSVLCWLPAAFFVSLNLYNNYLCASCGPTEPVVPFPGLSITYLIVPAVFIILTGVLAYGGTFNQAMLSNAPRYVAMPGKNLETWSWLFMRWSGGLLILLIWIHVLANALLTGAHHIDLQYVADRWAQPLNWGSTFTILFLAIVHGLNGFRLVLGDYVHGAAINRFINIVLVIACVVLVTLGAVAMIAGVQGV
ncbi:MAG: succinate dehydrogenase, cytochrome b556 subunit [Anaerolineales bacterium]